MKSTGRIVGFSRDFDTRTPVVQLTIEDNFEQLEALRGEELSIDIKTLRARRSKDANAMLWACCADIAAATGSTKWEVYLEELRRYGIFQYVEVELQTLPKLREVWRTLDVIESSNGIAKVHCYYGSHLYNSKEFSFLLNGVVEDMKELGLPVPPSKEMRRALEEFERKEKRNG